MNHRSLLTSFLFAGLVLWFVFWLQGRNGEMGLVWDEPPTIERVDALEKWFAEAGSSFAGFLTALQKENLEKGWPFCHEAPDEHPPVAPLLFLIFRNAFESHVGPMDALRLTTVFLFAVALGVMFRFVQQRWGILPALTACGSLLFHPRMLAEAQLFTLDMPLAVFWFLAGIVLLRTCERGRKLWLFGLVAGITIMCKATGILVLICALLWAILYRPRNVWKAAAWSIIVVPITMLLLHPGLLLSPYAGFSRWIHVMLNYPQKIPVYFFGQVIDFRSSFLPWHNAFTLIAILTPLGIVIAMTVGLLAGLVGLVNCQVRRFAMPRSTLPASPSASTNEILLDHRIVAGWAAINFLVPCVLRMFHFMPSHDGLRQLVYIFPWGAILAGYAVFVMTNWMQSWCAIGKVRLIATAATLAILLPASWATVKIQPFGLSYYGELIGGPTGALRAGFESTYYWDACTQTTLDWMKENLPKNAEVILLPPPDVRVFQWYTTWRMFPREDVAFLNWEDLRLRDRLVSPIERPRYILLQMRQGFFLPRRAGDANPYLELNKKKPIYEFTPPSVGVRLLAIYRWSDLKLDR